MTLSIIIVSYNTSDLTVATINSALDDLNQSTLKKLSEIIVIDNDSKDDSIKSIKNALKNQSIKYLIIKNKENLGFAKANNLAIKRSRSKNILLLNSDTIVKKGSLEKLVNSLEKSPAIESTAYTKSHHGELDKLGIISATLLNNDGSFQPHGGSFPTLFSLFNHMSFLDDIPIIGKLLPSTQHTGKNTRSSNNKNKLIQQDWVGGTAVLIKKQVFDEIGLLDPNIFMYGEDIELCIRAKNHHWDIAIHPTAFITHLGSASSSSANAILGEFRGYIYIWSKHKPLWQLPIAKFILKLGAIMRIVVFGTISPHKIKKQIYIKALKEI